MTAPDRIQITHQPRTMTTPAPKADPSHIDQLAAIIRKVDGNNSMGAAALAEAILERYPLAFLVDPPAAAPAPEVVAGEVGELVAALRADAECVTAGQPDLMQLTGQQLTRIAEILQAVILGGWIVPTVEQVTPLAPEPGEVGELVNSLTLISDGMKALNHEADSWVVARAAALLQRLASPAYLVVGRPPEGVSDLLKSEPGEIQVCTAGVSIEPLVDAPRPTFQDAIKLAQGCHDYSGGHTGTEGEVWHGAIDTVVGVLKKAAIGPWDSQTSAVYGVGVEAQAGDVGVLVKMLTQEAAILEAHCNKIANGECRNLACLQRGGYIRGTESLDSSIATCHDLEKAVAKRRAAALLKQQDAELAALRGMPVAVSERPWERKGWCDAEGRCWLGSPGNRLNDHGWVYRKPCELLHQTVSLPHDALPLPAPQPGEVEA